MNSLNFFKDMLDISFTIYPTKKEGDLKTSFFAVYQTNKPSQLLEINFF